MMIQNQVFLRNPDFIYRIIEEDMILVPTHANVADLNCLYTLNDVGVLLWEKLAKPCDFASLVKAVTAEYQVEAETTAKDIEVFIDELLSTGALFQVEE